MDTAAVAALIRETGVQMPSIAIRETDGTERLVRSFTYDDFASALS
jgi:carboxynorspermidine decarboxylase